jgi:hypothetical protein
MSTHKYSNEANMLDIVNTDSPKIKIFPNYYSLNKLSSKINSEDQTQSYLNYNNLEIFLF